jgi:CheY-like chemotaxis protein
MRILVVDDYLNVEMALRGILEGHTVTGVRDPVALPKMLAHEEPFDQAIVDLRYAQSAATGLTALATLRELSPSTKTIISTTDEEENRLLYLLAAFQFFEPRAMLAKRADAFVTRAVVDAIGRGRPSPNADADPFRKAAAIRPTLLDQVVHNRTELGIWQELARFDKRQEIANAAHVHPRTLDAFTASKCAAIDLVNAHFPRPARGSEPPAVAEPAAAHGANLIRVIHSPASTRSSSRTRKWPGCSAITGDRADGRPLNSRYATGVTAVAG